ncbi:MAG: riboflavin synthase [Candidatus Binataceae bacterium]
MFTGIIEDLGTIDSIKRSNDNARIAIRTALPGASIKIGDSIAVNGVCVTVVAKGRGKVAMDLSAETLRRTTLGGLDAGQRVNLERCLTLDKLIGGHLVQGHVDGIARLKSVVPEGDSKLYEFEASASDARYLIEKGSVAIDGVSLTVFAIRGNRFSCALIPHTLKVTTLGLKAPGAEFNMEIDMLAKYVERMLAERGQSIAVTS